MAVVTVAIGVVVVVAVVDVVVVVAVVVVAQPKAFIVPVANLKNNLRS